MWVRLGDAVAPWTVELVWLARRLRPWQTALGMGAVVLAAAAAAVWAFQSQGVYYWNGPVPTPWAHETKL